MVKPTARKNTSEFTGSVLKLHTAAIILAAGLSSRMQEFKPLLKIGNKTMLEHAIGLFRYAGVEDIIVVLGHRAEDVIPVVEHTNARWLLNSDFAEGMFSSIQCGVRGMYSSCNAFFLLPVDIPLVAPTTLLQLLDTFDSNPEIRICYPYFAGRRGHPPLIDADLAKALLDYDGTEGMRGFLRKFADYASDVSVTDKFVAMDADTPAAFSRLQEAYLRKD